MRRFRKCCRLRIKKAAMLFVSSFRDRADFLKRRLGNASGAFGKSKTRVKRKIFEKDFSWGERKKRVFRKNSWEIRTKRG
jgi:hypothetical protein